MQWLAAWFRWSWFRPTTAVNLAVSRIVVCGGLLGIALFDHPERWAAVDPSFWLPIPLFRLLHWSVAPAGVLELLSWAFRLALLLACLGLGTRLATAAAFGLGLYLLGLPQNFGKVDHSETVPVLVLGILAVSRCGEALSLDRWRRNRATGATGALPPPSPEFTWPIRLAWLLMVTVFAAAGFGKLRGSGLEWVTSDTMRNLLVRHHYTHVPPLDLGLRLAEWPGVCHALAAATLVLEVLCPLALISRRLRLPLMFGLLGMQVGILLLMGIDFRPYFPCYAVWVPWDRLAERLGFATTAAAPAALSATPGTPGETPPGSRQAGDR